MRSCPACGNQYSDDTLKFCLQDGTRLHEGRQDEVPTVVLNEGERAAARSNTVGTGARGGEQVVNPYVTRTGEVTKRSNTALAVGLTALGMLLLFGVIGIAAWLYSRSGQTDGAKNTDNQTNKDTVAKTVPTPAPATPSRTPVPAKTADAPLSADDPSRIRKDVDQTIAGWRSATESKDMVALSDAYAETLEYYYTKRNVSSRSVVTDKQRAFRDYTSIEMDVALISISPDASGQAATAVFDKEWTFSGAKPFCGTVRSQMLLRKVDGEWLIAGEKDIPGTFRRTC